MTRSSKHRAPFVETLESRQFLSASAATCDIADPAPVDPKAIVVAKPAKAVNGKTVFGEAKAGIKLTFKKTKSLPGNSPIINFVHESGTFKDEKGNTGTYELAIPPKVSAIQPPQILNLSWKRGVNIQRSITLEFTPISKRLSQGLNNKTVSFTTVKAGTAAKGIITSGYLKPVYLKY